MTRTQDDTEGKRLLALLKEDQRLSGFSIEDFIDAIREYVEEDLSGYVEYASTDREPPHPLVVECLEACINHLGDAKMAYYASLK